MNDVEYQRELHRQREAQLKGSLKNAANTLRWAIMQLEDAARLGKPTQGWEAAWKAAGEGMERALDALATERETGRLLNVKRGADALGSGLEPTQVGDSAGSGAALHPGGASAAAQVRDAGQDALADRGAREAQPLGAAGVRDAALVDLSKAAAERARGTFGRAGGIADLRAETGRLVESAGGQDGR